MRLSIRSSLASLLLSAPLLLLAAVASAQPAPVVQRLARFGRMERGEARALAQTIHEQLTQNAARGGDRYDAIRQVLGQAMYGGPGSSRSEYDQRLQGVIARLGQGLTEQNLVALFGPTEGAGLRCARTFSVPMGQCDALVAAAAQQQADFPYLAPDDGSALLGELGTASTSQAQEITQALGRVLLSVPASLDNSPRGRRLEELTQACPGGLSDLESRVRAWHMGPTPGIAQCIGRAIGQEGRSAPRTLATVLGLSQPSAVTFLRWSHGQSLAQAAPPPPPPPRPAPPPPPPPPPPRPSIDVPAVMAQANTHYRARRYPQAAELYAQVTQADPSSATAFTALGASRLAAGDAAGAVTAFRSAARLAPTDAAVQVGLGRALVQTGDRDGAVAAYEMALALAPGRQDATRALAELRADPADRLREEARAHFAARRYLDAARAYHRLSQMRPTDASSFAGLGGALLSNNQAREAVPPYRRATELAPDNSRYHSALGTALMASGDQAGARASFERAVQLDANNTSAQQGLARLSAPPQPAQQGGTVTMDLTAGPTLPEVPGRADIVRTLQPLGGRLTSCAPAIHATVAFRMVIGGSDGRVRDVQVVSDQVSPEEAECMAGQVRGVIFPRFTRETLEITYPFLLEGPDAPEEAPPPVEH